MELSPLSLDFADIFITMSWLLLSGGSLVIFVPVGLRVGGWVLLQLRGAIQNIDYDLW